MSVLMTSTKYGVNGLKEGGYMAESIRIVYEEGSGEYVEKKSRFIATLRPVSNLDEASEFIEEMKKKYWDARHNCYAFVIGDNNEVTRCSDDGEPSGTAGRPMLEVLIGEGVHNAAVVVTRYFGGVLLGTGGLVRAYQAAVKEGIHSARIIEKTKGVLFKARFEYSLLGKFNFILAEEGLIPMDTEYGADVTVTLPFPGADEDRIIKKITEGLDGNVSFEKAGDTDYAVLEGKIIIL